VNVAFLQQTSIPNYPSDEKFSLQCSHRAGSHRAAVMGESNEEAVAYSSCDLCLRSIRIGRRHAYKGGSTATARACL
jgi:hypothetical protein